MEYAVVKLGGALVSPEEGMIDSAVVKGYVRAFKELFGGKEIPCRMVVVVGGGNVSRMYRDYADVCGEDSDVDRHRIGITATWINAELIRSLIDDIAYKRVLGVGVYAENRKEAEGFMAKDFDKWLTGDEPILVSGGFINGASTDFNAVLLASKLGVDRIYKLTDIDHIYTDDPDRSVSAKPLENITWSEYLRIFGESFDNVEHKPGAHMPVDLLAAKLANDNGIGCFLTDGRDPKVLVDIVRDRKVQGTLVHG